MTVIQAIVNTFACVGAGVIAMVSYIAVTELWWEYKRRKVERLRLDAEKSFRGIK